MPEFKINYQCNYCGDKPKNPQSMLCDNCGGDLKSDVNVGVPATTFEPHYCPTIKQYVSSWSDQEKKAKAFRSADHPEGFNLLQANKPYLSHLKKVYANREDIKAEQYAKDGIKYPKGKDVYFHPQENRFVNKFTKRPIDEKKYVIPNKPLRVSEKLKLKAASILLAFMFVGSLASAKIEGVPYLNLDVKGVVYEVPIYKPDFTEEKAKMIMDALSGDKNAREIVLQTKAERIIFIGDGDKIRWLHITRDNEWVETLD